MVTVKDFQTKLVISVNGQDKGQGVLVFMCKNHGPGEKLIQTMMHLANVRMTMVYVRIKGIRVMVLKEES